MEDRLSSLQLDRVRSCSLRLGPPVGRGIDMTTLRDELDLKIDDLSEHPKLKSAVWDYFWFMRDHMARNGNESFVHAVNFF